MLQLRSHPEAEQQRLTILFAKLWSSYARPPYDPHHKTARQIQFKVRSYKADQEAGIEGKELTRILVISLLLPLALRSNHLQTSHNHQLAY